MESYGNPDVVVVSGEAGDHWLQVGLGRLTGAPLAVGRYSTAAGDYSHVTFDGRGGCPGVGTFEILDIAYGAGNYVQRLHLTFDFQCDGAGCAAHGEVVYEGLPARTDFEVTASVGKARVTAAGEAGVDVTVTCNERSVVGVYLIVSQPSADGVVEGVQFMVVPCAQHPATFSVVVSPADRHFTTGPATLSGFVGGSDEFTGRYVSADLSGDLRLRRG